MFLIKDAYTSNGAYNKGQKVGKNDPAFKELTDASLLVETKDEIDPKVETLIEKVNRLEEALAKGGSSEKLEDEIVELKKTIADLESANKTLTKTVKDLEAEKDDIQGKLDKSIADNTALVDELEKAKTPTAN